MKKLSLLLIAIFLFGTACSPKSSKYPNKIDEDKIYFFHIQSCTHCHDADAYIQKKHSQLEIIKVDVADKDGFELFIKCAKKFKLNNEIGTPLFCMGKRHLMGWSPQIAKRFDRYARPFYENSFD